MMNPLLLLSVVLIWSISPYGVNATERGILTGGQIYDLPDWFRQGFLEFDLEVSEARENGKQVMAFLHLDECPYCVRMLDENFRTGETRKYLQENFHVVGVDLKGSLDVTWSDGNSYTERELAEHLRIYGTPAIVFLDQDGKNVLQLNGYRDPVSFRRAVNFVQQRHYKTATFSDYLNNLNRVPVYELADHELLQKVTYFKDYNGPLVVLFEDRFCEECARFHERTLNHPDVMAGLKDFLFVRLDAESEQTIVTPKGHKMTVQQWMNELGLTFRPSLVMYNAGRELFRADGIKYHHHLSEGLAYVRYGYRQYPEAGDFKKAYRAQLMENGVNVDFSE